MGANKQLIGWILKGFFVSSVLVLLFATLTEDNDNGNTYKVKLQNGDTLRIKESDTKCTKEATRTVADINTFSGSVPAGPTTLERFYKCRANGVRTDLAGYVSAFSLTTERCLRNSREIPCLAGKYFNRIDENYFYTGKEENYCFRADGSRKESTSNSKRCKSLFFD